MIYIKIIFSIIFLEIVIYFLINFLKKDFKWLINKDDELPDISNIKLKNFYKNSFDALLGWDRKKNTYGEENSEKKTFFSISKDGSRFSKKYKKNRISVYGDSFAFCRYVNNDETWECFLEKFINEGVKNYGVGNYGLDQSFLKYLKKKNTKKKEIIIFNVVPETIARIRSYWKHYREFGNTLAFKPVVKIKNLKIKTDKIKFKKFDSKNKIYKSLEKIKKKDIFYNAKFRKHLFVFPYIFSFFRKLNFNSLVIFWLLIYKSTNNKKYYNKAIKVVLNLNIKESHLMYDDEQSLKLLHNLIKSIDLQLKKDNKKMMLIITPQLLDIKSSFRNLYSNFYSKVSKEILCLDLTESIIKEYKRKNLFVKDIYGGHLNKNGNKFIANQIHKFLIRRRII